MFSFPREGSGPKRNRKKTNRKAKKKEKKRIKEEREPAGFRQIRNYHCKALFCFLYKERKES